MIYALLLTHWLSDFVLQTDDMAKNKSKSNMWLTVHVMAYMLPFVLVAGAKFAVINGLAHWLIDWCTSRFNSKMWTQGKVHEFFVGVGLDQFLHTALLIYTAPMAQPLFKDIL